MARLDLLLLGVWLALAGPIVPAAVGAPTVATDGLATLPLVQAGGKPFRLADVRGKWVWLYLGFLNCPDACPTTMSELAAAYKRLARPEDVQVMFVSVDPGRDTPAALARYTAYFDPAFLGVTGPSASLEHLARFLGTSFEVRPGTANAPAHVSHPNRLFLIDPAGRLAGSYLPDETAPTGDGGVAAYFTGLQAGHAPAESAPRAHSTAELCQMPAGASGPGGGMARHDPLMGREATLGSGTSVLPAESPMRMLSWRAGDWLWMVHGRANAAENYQDGPRGALGWTGENWAMLMGSRALGPGLLDLRAMASLEPLTLPEGGTPQLFQTGESYHFNPLVDKQHPHDLLMELAGRYTWSLGDRLALFLYGGPAGEPALGPTAAMHRPSAADNAWVPLGHHVQDSTHIAYGVGTLGARYGDVQLEGSIFNGREPDEYRYDLDLGPLDSYAARLSYFPGRNWVAQLSTGFLHEPELLHPGDAYRTTASLTHVTAMPFGRLASSLIWGQNVEVANAASGPYPPFALEGYGLESQLDFDAGEHLYGRFEAVDKHGLPPGAPLNHTIHRIEALTLGWVHDLTISPGLAWGLGGDLTLYGLDQEMKAIYGFNPLSFRVYLRLQPPAMAAM